jgi:hypothetical protein
MHLAGTRIVASAAIPDTIFMGTIASGACDTILIPLNEAADTSVAIDSVYIAGADSIDFSIIGFITHNSDSLPDGHSASVRLRYCPTSPGCAHTGLFVVVHPSNGTSPPFTRRIGLGGCSGTPGIDIDHRTLDFGPVLVDNCRSDSFTLANHGSYPLIIDTIILPNRGYTIEPAAAVAGFSILPDSSRTIAVRFCPTADGRYDDTITIVHNVFPPRATIYLHGVAGRARIWLDTAAGNAGELVTLHARLDAALARTTSIGRYSLRLVVTPTALFPKRVIVPRAGASATMRYDASGTITIDGDNAGGDVSDGDLVEIEMRGLSTSAASNRVAFTAAVLNDTDSLADRGDGIVKLSGCDIDYGVSLTERLAIKSVHMEHASQAEVVYRAPLGSAPMLEIVDLSGGAIATMQLPEGNAAEQQVTVPVSGLARGLYLLVLHTGAERTVVPIVVAN